MKKSRIITLALALAALFTFSACAPGTGSGANGWTWKYDDTQHWQERDKDGAKKNFGDHVDADSDGLCDTCNCEMEQSDVHFPHAASEYIPTDDGLIAENIVDDKYDTYYQIFVYSFCDSDGNGRGDLNGITSKLEYLRKMGFTGIWLTPITKGASNHKYDVIDYKTVDPVFGDLEDFEKLVNKAHELGIKIILDMAFNHTSNRHEWFSNNLIAFLDGNTSDPYYNYYNLSSTEDSVHAFERKLTYKGVARSVYFESSQGQENMPDLNLNNPAVKNEIADIIKFWIYGYNVDGFRLDACKNYFNNNTASADFVSYITAQARKWNPNAYIIGEVYDNDATISSYYRNSTADSFLWFPEAYFPSWSWPNHQGTIGKLAKQAVNNSAAYSSSAANEYFSAMQSMITAASGDIPAPFLDSHDTDRIADGAFNGNETMIKFGYGMFAMYSGNTFTYYGDEIGAMGVRERDSSSDSNRRLGMLWCKDDLVNHPVIPMDSSTPNYKFGGVVEQVKDPNSILNFVKKCNNARNAFPALMRGTPSRVSYSDSSVLVVKKAYRGQDITVIINFSNAPKSVPTSVGTGTFRWGVSATNGSVTASGSSISMPGYSFAIMG